MSSTRPALGSRPVFLGGENRSGTTLLSVVLDSHPELVVGPELDFLEPSDLGPHVLAACDLLASADPRVLGPGTATEDPTWYHEAHFVKQCQRFGLDFPELRELADQTMKSTGTELVDFEDRCSLLEAIGEHRRAATGARRWGVKLQRKIAMVDQFARRWPRAQFVHIVRDGRDVAASHLKTVVNWGHPTIEAAARGWLEVVERPPVVAPPDRYLEIRYEDLVAHPHRTLETITDFLGLWWSDDLLRHDQLSHTLHDAPWGHPAAAAVARPLTTERIGRYRSDLTPYEIAQFEIIAGHQLQRFGYL